MQVWNKSVYDAQSTSVSTDGLILNGNSVVASAVGSLPYELPLQSIVWAISFIRSEFSTSH